MVRVKICGVTSVSDAQLCARAGADAIGLNFVASSPRCITRALAREIVAALAGEVVTVGVFVDEEPEAIAACRHEVGFRCAQLHGDESPEAVTRLLPRAFKALRVRDPSAVELAASFPGAHLLLDAYVEGAAGGTGATFDWVIAAQIARTRRVMLAGGLTPDNVAAAVAAVRPFGVDVASGVESAPGKKDPAKLRAFVARAKGLQSPSGYPIPERP